MAELDEFDITQLLRFASDGNRDALDRVLPRLYGELRSLARGMMRREDAGHTLQPTALVSEAWIRIAKQERLEFEDRGKFLQAAAATMRRVLVDHSRRRASLRRGGAFKREPLDGLVAELEGRARGPLTALEVALEALSEVRPRAARLIELRFFAGLPMQEVAEALEASLRETEREWTFARAWIRRKMDQDLDA